MNTRKVKIETAIFAVAVLFIGLLVGSCVTPHQIEEVRADISQLREENQTTQDMISRVDSLMTNLDKGLANSFFSFSDFSFKERSIFIK